MPATAAAEKDTDHVATRFAKDQLKAFVERIEKLEEEKKAISDDIRDVYAEAKGNGFDVKALRMVIRWSGTEPKLRLMVEAREDGLMRRALESLEQAARADLNLG